MSDRASCPVSHPVYCISRTLCRGEGRLTVLVPVIDLQLLVLVRQTAEELDGAEVRGRAVLVAVHDADGS